MRDPTDIAAQEREAEAERQQAETRRKQEVEDFKWLTNHAPGRRILWRVLERAGVFRTSFDGTSRTYFNEGRRDLGLFLLAELHEIAPDAYPKMLKENTQ